MHSFGGCPYRLIERDSTVFAIGQDWCHNSVSIIQVSTPKAISQTWATMVLKRLRLSSNSLIPCLPWVCDCVIVVTVYIIVLVSGDGGGKNSVGK